MIRDTFDVLLVGRGVAASATAMRIMQFATEPLSIVAVERFPQRRNGGLAYGAPGTAWHDVFNIQAGRMSIFREDVDDFLRWANDEADRRYWHPDWKGRTFAVSDAAPRCIYADYITDRLHQALAEAPEGTTYQESVGEVIDVEPRTNGGHQAVRIRVHDGTGEMIERIVQARHVVVATGNEFGRLAFTEACYDHPAFVRLQYSADGYTRMRQVGEDDTVVIIGSALSGFDAAVTLGGSHLRCARGDRKAERGDEPPPVGSNRSGLSTT
ncbi:MAG: FAD/NAD(P)-binding protein [Actinomycetota bacterium]